MKNRELLPSLFLLALSFFICDQAAAIGIGSLRQPGPGLLDFCAGIVMGVVALYLLLAPFFAKKPPVEGDESGIALKGWKLWTVCITLFVYAFAVTRLCFLISTFVFIIFLLRLVEVKKWWRLLLEALLITAGNYVVFVVWLGCELPTGILPW